MQVVLKCLIFAIPLWVSLGALAAPVVTELPHNNDSPTSSIEEGECSTRASSSSATSHATPREHGLFYNGPSYKSLLGGDPTIYIYKPSTKYDPVMPEDKNDSFYHYIAQLAESGEYPAHQANWQDWFKMNDQWEEVIAKCYYTLINLGHDGGQAYELLTKYGCNEMAQVLRLGNVRYDEGVVLELLKRKAQDDNKSGI